MPKIRTILGVKLNITSTSEVLSQIEVRHKKGEKFIITTPNPEQLVIANSDQQFKDILNNTTINIPDGIGLLFAEKFLYGKNMLQIIKGREIFLKILEMVNNKKWKIVLLGDKNKSAQKAARDLSVINDQLTITGITGPDLNKDGTPKTKMDKVVEDKVINQINKIKPDFVFVGFGAPVQEKWLYGKLPKLNVIGTMVVGGTFDYITGKRKNTPAIFSKFGFEWLWRLVTGDQKLKRIWNAVFVFSWRVVLSKLNI